MSTSDDENNETIEELYDRAKVIRAEIEEFEKSKEESLAKEAEELNTMKEQEEEIQLQYSTVVPILKDDGSTLMERVSFQPKLESSKIITYQASLPLGMILSEHETILGAVQVTSLDPDGNAAMLGIKVGSLLRATTACQVTMERPTWQLIIGGVGQPKTKRFMYSVDNRPFEEVLDAVSSNRIDPQQRDVCLVLEEEQ